MEIGELSRIMGITLAPATRESLVNQGRHVGLNNEEAEDCAQMTQDRASAKVMSFEGRSEPEINSWLQVTNKRHALRILKRRKPHAEYGSEMGGDIRRRDPISPSFGARARRPASSSEPWINSLRKLNGGFNVGSWRRRVARP